jgi:cell division protein ZapA (FtsZ GTPase activity inhibitor)
MADETAEPPAADESPPDPVTDPAPDAAAPGSSRRSAVLQWGGVAAGVVGIALIVIGVLAFSSASSDDDATDAANRDRRELRAEELSAAAGGSDVIEAGEALGAEIDDLSEASRDLGLTQNGFVDAMNAATDLFSSGNESAARAGYEAQASAVAEMEQELAEVQAELAAARERLTEIEAGGTP